MGLILLKKQLDVMQGNFQQEVIHFASMLIAKKSLIVTLL